MFLLPSFIILISKYLLWVNHIGEYALFIIYALDFFLYYFNNELGIPIIEKIFYVHYDSYIACYFKLLLSHHIIIYVAE